MMTRSRTRLARQALENPDINSTPTGALGNWIELPTEVSSHISKNIK